MSKISKEETIIRVEKLIESGDGDLGRLYHILEFLKNNRELYHSDQKYLESKLHSHVSLQDEISESDNDRSLLSQIQTLIESGDGDPGRLQHIYDMLSKDKPLYHSDLLYLESKLKGTMTDHYKDPETKTISSETKTENSDTRGSLPKGWDYDPQNTNEVSSKTESDSKPKTENSDTRGSLPKGWDSISKKENETDPDVSASILHNYTFPVDN